MTAAWRVWRWLGARELLQPWAGRLATVTLLGLVLWSLVALLWWQASGRLALGWAAALAGLLVLAVVLSASRTGLVGVLMLGLWGLVDRRMSTPTPRSYPSRTT